MNIHMKRTFLKHEGGTKFYQAFLISCHDEDGNLNGSCSITHYGPMHSIKGGDVRPIAGGNSLIFGGSAKYTEQVNQKLKRGYSENDEENFIFTSVADAKFTFTRWFGATRRDQIMLHLGLTVDGEEVAAKSDPSAAVEDTPIETKDPFAGRPAAWGSW